MSESTPSPVSSTLEYYRPLPKWSPSRPKQRYWLHILLLLATCFTTLVMGARMQYNFQHNRPALSFSDAPIVDRAGRSEAVPFFPAGWLRSHPARLLGGVPFMATLMLFFLAHEMGHYLYCRRYGVYATLPFFIPMPTPIGTMGAVILIRSRIRSRTALFDIGIAGPIAGFIVALAVLLVSLAWSKPIHPGLGQLDYELGYPLIFTLVHYLLASIGLIHGAAALPLSHILLHPTAIAAWVGMLATSLNLLPGGQLDGGHIIFSIAPRTHKLVSRMTILILLPMAYYLWTGWFVWAILLWLSSFRHPQVAEWPRVSGARLWLAAFALFMLAVTLTPAPLAHSSLLEMVRQMRGQ
ncbi:MAG TPA: site-2 protease family protein [Candidatus Deferrimicrobiaceae bacterium]|nr:site-2 protease family protein [Candidatus Deferrimicrobiaceae bacterium]